MSSSQIKSSPKSSPEASTCPSNYYIAKDKPRRNIKPPQRYAEADLVAYDLNVAEDIDCSEEPSNYSEAVSCPESGRYITTMHEKMESLHKNSTWKFTKLLKNKKTVKCKWIFKRKEGIPGVEKARDKARLVAKGYSQFLDVDFIDVFSPVVKHSSIQALLGIVAI